MFELSVTSTATGQAITSFAQPLVLHFPAGASGTPAYSRDGTSWTTIPALSGAWLPPDLQDGSFVNDDGSVDIYTRHATYYALLALAAPIGLTARLHGGTLTLNWQPGRNGGTILRYQILLNGSPVAATAATHVDLHAFARDGVSRYELVAVGQGAQKAAAVAAPIAIVPVARPHGIPRAIPRWAWKLLAWQQHGASRGARPAGSPRRPAAWYSTWKRWRLAPWNADGS